MNIVHRLNEYSDKSERLYFTFSLGLLQDIPSLRKDTKRPPRPVRLFAWGLPAVSLCASRSWGMAEQKPDGADCFSHKPVKKLNCFLALHAGNLPARPGGVVRRPAGRSLAAMWGKFLHAALRNSLIFEGICGKSNPLHPVSALPYPSCGMRIGKAWAGPRQKGGQGGTAALHLHILQKTETLEKKKPSGNCKGGKQCGEHHCA